MLSFEWRELETLCEHISDLRHRCTAAQRSRNMGLADGLKEEIVRVKGQRERLVHHISARLSSATTQREHPSDAAARNGSPHGAAPTHSALLAASADSAGDSEGIVGFSRE